MTRPDSVKLKCVCGHIMGTRKANTLNEMNGATLWKCSKCGKQYQTNVEVIS